MLEYMMDTIENVSLINLKERNRSEECQKEERRKREQHEISQLREASSECSIG